MLNNMYDELDEENKRYCEFCEQFVYDEDFDREYGGCRFCRENDDRYNDFINRRNAMEERADLERDIRRDEGR